MSDPHAAGEPTPEELQAYLEQLREADVAEVVVQAFNMLATGAQVKLGRRDARAVIDAMDAMVGAAAEALPAELADQMRSAVGQLKAAQVQAEAEVAGQPQAGSPPQPGQGGPQAAQRTEQAGSAGPDQQGHAGEQGERLTDRLWVPGRGPGG